LLKKVCIIENKNSFLVLPFKNTCTFIHKKTHSTLTTEIMNYLKFALPILLMYSISTLPLLLFGQENCKVLNPAISGTYEGKCKNGFANGKGIAIGTDKYEGQFSKGLADGEGTYTWSTGEKYVGEWKTGQRNGVGTYIMHVIGKDSIQSGMWKNDKYMGPKPKQPNIIYKVGVDRYNFKRTDSPKNRVLVDIFQNGSRNRGVSNLNITSTSGYEVKVGESVGYNEVVFPIFIRIRYTTFNKTHAAVNNVTFDFELFEPGDWTVELHN
jgi:hypothetical protein